MPKNDLNFDFATRSAIFWVSKMGTFGKSDCFRTTKNGTSSFCSGRSAQIKIIEENKSGLEFNIPSKSKCASLNFEIWPKSGLKVMIS